MNPLFDYLALVDLLNDVGTFQWTSYFILLVRSLSSIYPFLTVRASGGGMVSVLDILDGGRSELRRAHI